MSISHSQSLPQVDLTTNHLGYFEFHLCVRDEKDKDPLTHACFEQHALQNPKSESKFNIGSAKGYLKFKIQLPQGITCKACVLRWKYSTGK